MLLLFLFFLTSAPAAAKQEHLDHGSQLDLSDVILQLEKRLSKSKFDSHLFDKQKSSSDLPGSASENKPSSMTSHKDDVEKQREMCKQEESKGKIIRATDSLNAGAEFVDSIKDVESNSECQKHCCKNSSCDVAVYQDKEDRYCYLFHCEGKCLFKDHGGYSINTVTRTATSDTSMENNGGQGSETDLENLSVGRDRDSSRGTSKDKASSDSDISSENGQPSGTGNSQSEQVSEGKDSGADQGPPATLISQHSVSLSGYCTRDNQCEDTNAACSDNNCRCRPGFYNKEGICRTVCSPSSFECFELGTITRGPECVPKAQVCDSYMQCADGSDEFNCGTVNAASPQQGVWNGQYLDPYLQSPRANLQQHQQMLQQQRLQAQQQQPSNRPGITAPEGYSQQQPTGNLPQQQQVRPSGVMQPSASSLPHSMKNINTNSAPVGLANTVNSESQGHTPQRLQANADANQNPKFVKLTPTSSKSMQSNNAVSSPAIRKTPLPSGEAAHPLPVSSSDQGFNFQSKTGIKDQAQTSKEGTLSSVGSPVVGSKQSQDTFNTAVPSETVNKVNSVVGRPVLNNNYPPDSNGPMRGSEGNMIAPNVGNNQGQPHQQNALPQSQLHNRRPQQPDQLLTSVQQKNMDGTPAGQPVKSPSIMKQSRLGINEASSQSVVSSGSDKMKSKVASHIQHPQNQLEKQNSQLKSNPQSQGQRQHGGNYRPSSSASSNGQQWGDPSVYIPYNFGGSDLAGSQRQQQGLQPTLGAGGYFDSMSSRYYPGGYGQMSNAYGQDNIPYFSNTASADDFSQFGEPYLSPGKSLSNNGYLSGGYPDMGVYDGSPSASSSHFMQSANNGGYDFDGGYRSPQSYQDLDVYSPMSGQQSFKSGPSYKTKNTGYKAQLPDHKIYGTNNGLYEDARAGPTGQKPNSKGEKLKHPSKTEEANVEIRGPTTTNPKPVSQKGKSGGANPTSEDSKSKETPSKSQHVAGENSKSTHKPGSSSSPSSPPPNHKLDSGGSPKHLFVSSTRERVIIASPGGGNAKGPIVALSLGLALTLVLLVMVVCRLRGVKHRLRKGRPLSQNEADYLINGMYL
ncbi:low-density lipoprotein receptor-related protein 11 [Plakobranchus ocellatus]|uniref:Low-density lipoprotein receptor-related protein 11 n=1 Tax=Plakobranchus ocellatus TaxID=259542 RepID=A0AAV4DWK9_9GAST|nr:low-density lipoprotein receptor-related protein 11 [Plakobranchus ocellatus]